MKGELNLNVSGNEVYYTACSPLVILKNVCSKLGGGRDEEVDVLRRQRVLLEQKCVDRQVRALHIPLCFVYSSIIGDI